MNKYLVEVLPLVSLVNNSYIPMHGSIKGIIQVVKTCIISLRRVAVIISNGMQTTTCFQLAKKHISSKISASIIYKHEGSINRLLW